MWENDIFDQIEVWGDSDAPTLNVALWNGLFPSWTVFWDIELERRYMSNNGIFILVFFLCVYVCVFHFYTTFNPLNSHQRPWPHWHISHIAQKPSKNSPLRHPRPRKKKINRQTHGCFVFKIVVPHTSHSIGTWIELTWSGAVQQP